MIVAACLFRFAVKFFELAHCGWAQIDPKEGICAPRWVECVGMLGSDSAGRLFNHIGVPPRHHPSSGKSMATNAKNLWVGFDLGGTKMLAIAYDEKWKPVARRRRKTRGRDGSDFGVQRIASTIERLLDENELTADRIAGIGIGCPGPIDLDHGRILTTPNLGWDDVDVQAVLEHRFSCPVVVMNDVDAGVYGEYEFGAAKGGTLCRRDLSRDGRRWRLRLRRQNLTGIWHQLHGDRPHQN